MTDMIVSEPPRSSTNPDIPVGRIVSVTGSRAIVLLQQSPGASERDQVERPDMGTLLRIITPHSTVFALVTSLRVESLSGAVDTAPSDGADQELWIAELELAGELVPDEDGKSETFRRGVTLYPYLNDKVYYTRREDLEKAYAFDDSATIELGSLSQDTSIPAVVKVDDLLGKHFAILGTTGTGKSCTVALVLRSILWDNPLAHILLIDPHNEYSASFGQAAEVISPDNLYLPYWFLTFQEICEIFVGDSKHADAAAEILADIIPAAKARYAQGTQRHSRIAAKKAKQRHNDAQMFSVDSPVPYRISDLLDMLMDRMGRLEHKNTLGPYKQLKTRIESLSQDPRYSFMFGSVTVSDDMSDILSRFFRVPVNNKPISILELTGLPSEVINVVVSVMCRMAFDFSLWSDGLVPLTIVCEEAHRYIPRDATTSFGPTRRAISRIAKEGRKYGVSIAIISQRPTELDPTILSQCNTVFAMRMSNEHDQEVVRAAIPDAAASLLEFLSSLGTGEAIAFGDGVTLPARIRFHLLPEHAMPRSTTAKFSDKWSKNILDPNFMDEVIKRWRSGGHLAVNSEEEADDALANTRQPLPEMAANKGQQPGRFGATPGGLAGTMAEQSAPDQATDVDEETRQRLARSMMTRKSMRSLLDRRR